MATELIGYSDKFSAAPGEKLAFKVSTDLPRYDVAIVRLIHGDDLEDAAWRTDFTLEVPPNLRSGIYAARLRGADREDHIPFFVRPGEGAQPARAALLVPTLTYLAYANERMDYSPSLAALMAGPRPLNRDPRDLYLVDHPELSASLYDHHRDGSGFIYASRLRPMTNLRPKYLKWRKGGPRHLAGDLYLVDWLEAKGFDCDVITDEDLHRQGLELLRDYRVLLTGTHPEYTTVAMLSALEQYLDQGGRLMYLGGNGFYWVTSRSSRTFPNSRANGSTAAAPILRFEPTWSTSRPPAEERSSRWVPSSGAAACPTTTMTTTCHGLRKTY